MAGPPPPGSPAVYPPMPTATNTSFDVEGVGYLKIGSILGILVQAMFWTGLLIFYLIFNALQGTVSTYGTVTGFPSWITVNTFYAAIGLLAVGLFLGIIGFVFFYLGFRSIKRGAPSFGAPTVLMILGLVGYLMTAIGVVVIVGTIVSSINNAVAGTISSGTASVDIGAILGALGLIGIGAILALVGVIGLVLGNWRAGTRYQEGTAKIGAILSIIPFVSIVGYILLLVGYARAGSKLKSGWAPQSEMMQVPVYYAPPPPPMQPPPQ